MVACSHGQVEGECLICRTLGPTASPPSPARTGPAPSGPEVARAYPVAPGAGPPAGRVRATARLAGAAAAIALLGVGAWLVVGAVFTILHILELVAVGVVGAWAGYRIGYFRGSRRPRS